MFRIVKHTITHETLPGIDSSLTVTPLVRGLQWAVTPKLTVIAGRQLSIGAASGAKLPFRFNSSRPKKRYRAWGAVCACK